MKILTLDNNLILKKKKKKLIDPTEEDIRFSILDNSDANNPRFYI